MTINTTNTWDFIPLSQIVEDARKHHSPTHDLTYELWSVPAYSDGVPEIVLGSTIKSSKLLVLPGDVLISKINPRINRVWLVEPSDLPQIGSTEWLVARVKDPARIIPEYLLRYLQSPTFRNWITHSASSVTGSHTRAKSRQILEQIVPVPSIDVQLRLCEDLRTHIEAIGRSFEELNHAEAMTLELRRSILNSTFEMSSTRNTPNVLGESIRLDKLAEIVRGVTYSSKDVVGEASPNSVKLLRATNIQDSVLDDVDPVFLPKELVKQKQMLEPSDLVIASSSGSIHVVGKSALVRNQYPATFGAFCTVIRPSGINPEYLAFYLQSPVVRQNWSDLAKGSNINNLKTSDIAATLVPVPSTEVQDQVAAYLHAQFNRLNSSLAYISEQKLALGELQRSLLNAAFLGQLGTKS